VYVINAPPLAYLHKPSWPGVAAHLPALAISNSKKLEKLAKSLFLSRFFFHVRYSLGPGKSLEAYGTIKPV